MKGILNSVIDLQQKYVAIPEYKKNSCINIDKIVPEIKINKDEDIDELSETKYEQLKINKRKRRRYKNSFINANNLVIFTESQLANKNIFSGATLNYFDAKEK